MQLHGVCDASEHASGAVMYLRAMDYEEAVHVLLVISKPKVAPNKTISLPQLELCGAVVTAKLLDHCRNCWIFL